MILVVMGVSGSGKTTVGTLLADALRCDFLEGDALHPPENVEKMRRGVPLNDADRAPWLDAVHARLEEAFRRGRCLVAACSALKESYRTHLSAGVPVTWVYLHGEEEVIRSRLEARTGHFFDPHLLASQLQTLEEPRDAIVVDVTKSPEAIVEEILTELRDRTEVRIEEDLEELSLAAAEAVVESIADAVSARGRCTIALAGGSTPHRLYTLLGSRFRDAISWPRIELFWTDERYVPHGDERSNYRMVRQALLESAPVPKTNVHPMPTHFAEPADAAREYESLLRERLADGADGFDLVLLGVGADGHTASLFPGSPALRETERWVVPVTASAQPPSRLTLTLPLLSRSARLYFLVAGGEKATAVREALRLDRERAETPAALVQRAARRAVWWLDREAASRLDEEPAPRRDDDV